MQERNLASRTRRAIDRLRRIFRRKPAEPESPYDPFAYVGAPKKRPPTGRSAGAVAELD